MNCICGRTVPRDEITYFVAKGFCKKIEDHIKIDHQFSVTKIEVSDFTNLSLRMRVLDHENMRSTIYKITTGGHVVIENLWRDEVRPNLEDIEKIFSHAKDTYKDKMELLRKV